VTRASMLENLERLVEVAPGTLHGPEELGALPGWDSLTQLTFVVQTERATGTRVATTAVAECTTVNDLLALFAL